jgi:speckle-type POZ protein
MYSLSLSSSLRGHTPNKEKQDMIKYLLVAADRYMLACRLKLICEGVLLKSLDGTTVATTLALVDQYNCKKLRDACIKYIVVSNRVDDGRCAVQSDAPW